MGQKANLLTLRKVNINLNLLSSNSKNFIYQYHILQLLKHVVYFKGIWMSKTCFNVLNNIAIYTFNVYYQTIKVHFYRQKTASLIFNLPKKLNFFFKLFNFYKITGLTLIIKNLNITINKELLKNFYKKTKKFLNILFSRRFNLYLDFLKLTSLFCENKIEIFEYLKLLGLIFKPLIKRKHNRFIFFLKYLFKIFINFNTENQLFLNIYGIKFSIMGKLLGKPRASSVLIKEGCMPIQGLEKNIEFSKIHVYTNLGAFGFKMWVYRK